MIESPTGPRAVIFGCDGLRLSAEERRFFADADPTGFILFARNVDTPDQLRRLTDDLRAAVGRDAMVLVDQEGGRVQRLRPPHWRDYVWTPKVAEQPDATEAFRLRGRLIAHELHAVGIDVNCAPMVDVPQPGADPIIADRTMGASPAEITTNARAMAEGMLAGGVLPVLKHLPGYGRATVDAHLTLPRTDAPLSALREVDFPPFRDLANLPLGMTGHMLYDSIDETLPATLSPACMRVIRDDIGFDGLLMTDDLSMGALDGAVDHRAAASLAAGCDVALHCNGEMAEMRAVAAVSSRLTGKSLARLNAALAARRAPLPFDDAAADARLAEMDAAHA